MRDYERLFEENKRLRDLSNSLRDEKEAALGEVSKLKVSNHNRLNAVSDECNMRVAHLESMLLESKERHKCYEERAYAVITSQEKMTEKWKEEHRRTTQYFERMLAQAQTESRVLQDQLVEAKSRARGMQRDQTVTDMARVTKDRASKSREKAK